jgi:hypothetical protein
MCFRHMSFSIPRHTSSHLKTRTPTQKIFGSPKLGEEDEKSGRLPSSGSAATRPTSGVGSCPPRGAAPRPRRSAPARPSRGHLSPVLSRPASPATPPGSPHRSPVTPLVYEPNTLRLGSSSAASVAACAASSLSRRATYSESESLWAASAFRAASCRRAPSVLRKPNLWRGGLQRCYLAGSPFPETATLNAAPLGISVSS